MQVRRLGLGSDVEPSCYTGVVRITTVSTYGVTRASSRNEDRKLWTRMRVHGIPLVHDTCAAHAIIDSFLKCDVHNNYAFTMDI